MGQEISFDSDKKEDMDGQMGQALKDHIGYAQEYQVDKQGKIPYQKEPMMTKAAGPDMAQMMNMTGDIGKGQPYPMLMQLPPKTYKTRRFMD